MKKNSEKTKFNLKDFLIKNKKNIVTYGGILLLIIICVILLKFFLFNNDSYASIKYQVYVDNKASSTKKDGGIIESDKSINGIKLSVDSKYKGLVYTDISNIDESKECYTDEECILTNKIDKISFGLTETIFDKYDIYYRVYSNNKWSTWENNGTTIDTEEKGFNKIQIRLVPKHAYLGDYLDGYEVIDNE